MAVEREPPKVAGGSPQKQNQPPFGNFKQPEFGQASPLQNRLDSNVVNMPKPYKARPEDHRAVPGSTYNEQTRNVARNFVNPFAQNSAQSKFVTGPSNSADVIEIPRPPNPPIWQSRPPAASTFSSFRPTVGGFHAVNHATNSGSYVDLTKPQEPYSLDNSLLDDRFGAPDPYTYIDAGKATENIKALLEGAFEDDEDKPRTRSQKKKLEAVVHGLADKVENLGIETDPKKEDHDDGEENEDDGTIEGLNVKLLPHQVDGVEWMKDKEITVKKKNGILPKGGILADDVRFSSKLRINANSLRRWD